MIDYSLPVARRTRQGRALIFKQYNEKKKGKEKKEKKEKKENNGVESASSSRLSRANCKIETESETVAVSDGSVEEIDVNDWGEEGSDVGQESMGLKNNENSNMGFEGMDHVDEIVVDDSEDDEVVFLGEGDMNCSGLKSGAERDEGVVCIDLDDEDVLSGEDVSDPSGLNSDGRRGRDEMVPSLTRKGESSCLNFGDRKSSGVVGRTLKRNEVEDGGDDAAVWDESYGLEKNKDEHGDDNVVLDGLRRNEDDDGGGNDVSVDSVRSETSLESSSSEEASDDEDYKVEKLERYGDFQQLSSDSRVEEEEKEEDAEEREIMKRGSHKRGRPTGVDVGLKRRKYGLNILFDSENEDVDEDGGADAVAWDESYGSERNKDEHGDDNVVLDGLRRNENEDDDGGGNDVSVDSVGSETSLESSSSEEGSDDEDDEVEKLESCGESSSSEEASDDEDYKVEKLERCGDFLQLSSDSRVEEEEKEEDAEEREIMKRGSHKRGRPNGVDVGLKRRKYGLDILRDSENEEDNINDDKDCSVNPSHELYCVARRTRSHFTAKLGKKKKKMEVGTFSHPLCIDEEEVESSSGHDDSDDSGDDVVGSEKFGSNYENEDNFSDEETYHGGKKTVSCSGKLKTNKGYDDECVRKVHERDEGKLRMATKGKSINLVKNCNDLEILVDSILKKGEVPLEELESSKDDACKDENYSAVAKMPLPLKFTFGVGESNPSKKSEDQKEMDELWADFELAQSGKKTVSCSGKFNTNKGYDEECVQKVHERDEEKLKMADKGKSMDLVKNCNALKFLVDSILKKGEVPLKELESSKDDACKDENYSAVAKMPLPLKFTFGVGESNPLKKSEDQKEMDELWADFELALMCSEIGSVNSAKVDDEDALPSENGVDRATLCHVGNHELILDEQVGLRCAFCSYVKMEIKYILPSFSTHHCGKSSWRDPGDEMNYSIFDDLRSQDFGCDSHSVCDRQAHAKATVWDIIPGIKSTMYPHQRDGFEFLWKNMAGGICLDELKHQTTTSSGSGCIISHAPGTGKTRLTIVFLQAYMKLHPTCRPVIVAPVSMLLTWEEEFRKWKFDIPFHNLNQLKLSGKESLTKNMEDYISLKQGGHLDQIVIRSLKVHSWKMNSSILGISYKLFGQLTGTALFRKELLEVPGLVVLDEGHIPRNFESRILKALSNIKTDKRIILSGTPFQNNFEELYNTLCLARPKFTSIKGKWESLTNPITKGTKDGLKCENLKKVRDMIDPFVHVHKGSILQEKLPGLRDSLVILQPTQLQKSLFDELGQHITRNHFKSDYLKSLISVHPTLLLKCGEEGFFSEKDKLKGLNHEAGVKTIFLVELIRLSKALNEKVLVFSQYLEPLTFVMDQLKFHFNWSEGNEVLYMHGQLEAKQRQSSINIFNDPTSEARVLLASIRACSEGINLVGASRVVLLDVVWNPSVERQAISRAHRLGQEKVVHIYHLIASKTNEEEKYCRQVEKDLLSELVFSSSGGSGDQYKISPLVSDDKILEEMVRHEKLKHIFEKIQQKDSKLIETFTI